MPAIELRPATAADEPFLRVLYYSTRSEEVAAWGWDSAMQQAFLEQQYAAYSYDRRGRAHQLNTRIVQYDGQPIGMIATASSERSVELNDIALLPYYRGRGIGSALLSAELEAAAAAGRGLFLHVLSGSPALRLYLRLGLRPIEDNGIYTLMMT
jgi:GNAT superfamily N-acetyltransferase